MFTAVLIDLGAVSVERGPPGQAISQWVVAACNRALTQGRCAVDSTEGDVPVTLATVRSLGPLRVRIEVRRWGASGAGWISRELMFSGRDPERERWRSVGLVVATLVGEVTETQPESAPSAPSDGDRAFDDVPGSEPGASPLAPAPVTVVERRRQRVPRDETRGAPEWPSAEAPRRGFVGVGVLGGALQDTASMRLGGSLRGGWQWAEHWQLSLGADYAGRALAVRGGEGAGAGGSPSALTARWWSAMPGLIHTQRWNERTLTGLGVHAGARWLEIQGDLGGVAYARSAWTPLVAASAELWFGLASGLGFWMTLDAVSPLASSEVVDARSDAVLARMPPWELSGRLGLGWAF